MGTIVVAAPGVLACWKINSEGELQATSLCEFAGINQAVASAIFNRLSA